MFQYLISVLSNDNLSFFENFIIWVNLFGAMYAVYWSGKASRKGLLAQRNIFLLVTGLAFIYIFGYLFLLISDVNFFAWSSIFRGISILVWPIVWAGPAISSITVRKNYEKLIEEEVNIASKILEETDKAEEDDSK